jgi:hypothetical protein
MLENAKTQNNIEKSKRIKKLCVFAFNKKEFKPLRK